MSLDMKLGLSTPQFYFSGWLHPLWACRRLSRDTCLVSARQLPETFAISYDSFRCLNEDGQCLNHVFSPFHAVAVFLKARLHFPEISHFLLYYQ